MSGSEMVNISLPSSEGSTLLSRYKKSTYLIILNIKKVMGLILSCSSECTTDTKMSTPIRKIVMVLKNIKVKNT
jgi:hypothetical protein